MIKCKFELPGFLFTAEQVKKDIQTDYSGKRVIIICACLFIKLEYHHLFRALFKYVNEWKGIGVTMYVCIYLDILIQAEEQPGEQ